jgi:hypothetical protein
MGSGMTEGCVWLGSGRRTGPVDGKSRGGGCLLAVLVILGWVRVKIGRARFRTMPIHRWRLLVIRQRRGSLMGVIRHVWSSVGRKDLAQITVPNISHCNSVLSMRVLTMKERRYGPGGKEMVAICERETSDFNQQ